MQSISGYIIHKAFKELQWTLQDSYLNHIETKLFKLDSVLKPGQLSSQKY
jgi:hypothetical protein